MIVTSELADYLTRVVRALDTNTLHPDARRTSHCPECDQVIPMFNDDHIVWVSPAKQVVVIVACEEYWIINPNLVGIDMPTWMHPDDESHYGDV